MKKTLVLFLALVLALSACSFAAAEEKPTLKVLGTYVGFDPNNDPTATAIEERTGYHMEYYVLPSENGMGPLAKTFFSYVETLRIILKRVRHRCC